MFSRRAKLTDVLRSRQAPRAMIINPTCSAYQRARMNANDKSRKAMPLAERRNPIRS